MRIKLILLAIALGIIGFWYVTSQTDITESFMNIRPSGLFSYIMSRFSEKNYLDVKIEINPEWNGYIKIVNATFYGNGTINSVMIDKYPIEIKPETIETSGKIDKGTLSINNGMITISGTLFDVNLGNGIKFTEKGKLTLEMTNTKNLFILPSNEKEVVIYHFTGKIMVTSNDKTNELSITDEKVSLNGIKDLKILVLDNSIIIEGFVEKIEGNSFVYG
ncbi:MAG: hypothetical protein J7K83_01115 [Candidatus Aenigmarchaeota archaeon]|nr:hypothetical protein [Candidatus Aenigmarchaeota archaeon]